MNDERDNYGAPSSDQQHRDGSYYISLFKYKSIDQSDPLPNHLKFLTFTQLWYIASKMFCLSNIYM